MPHKPPFVASMSATKEILILDLEVNQTVGVIAIERTGVPFLQVSIIYELRTQKLIVNVI